MLYIRSPELTHLLAESLYFLTHISSVYAIYLIFHFHLCSYQNISRKKRKRHLGKEEPKKGLLNKHCKNKFKQKRRKNIMNTSMKDYITTELKLKDMENVCGSGVITGFYNPYTAPGRKKDKTENEQKDN